MSPQRPLSIIVLGLVASLLVIGTFALLVEHDQVPDAIYALDGIVITALYGHGTFLAQNEAHTRTVGDLLDAVQTGATAVRNGTAGLVKPGTSTQPGSTIDITGAAGPSVSQTTEAG